jgi:hypothetical protein
MDVDFRVRYAAEQAAKVAAGLCGTDTPPIEWTELPAGQLGETRGSKEAIFLDGRGMSVMQAMRTAAHETRHLHKMRVGSLPRFGASTLDREWSEDDAIAFEEEALEALEEKHGGSLWFDRAREKARQ